VGRSLHCTSVSTASFSDSREFSKVVGDGGGILGDGAGGEVGETASSGVDGELGRVKGVAPEVGTANSG
jgi:hypothetical protein